jgi:hypothetical protein
MTNCELIRERAVDALTQGHPLPADVATHLRECADCRREVAEFELLWQDLGRLPVPAGSSQAIGRIAAALHTEAPKLKREESTIMKVTWLAAAALAGILVGGVGATTLIDKQTEAPAVAAAPAPAPDGKTYMLLLHESTARPADFTDAQMDSIVAEYTAWAGRLHEENRLVGAEKLADDSGRWLSPAGPVLVDRSEHVSGFFMVRAANYEEAVTIANASPHLKYGGTIEVREIEATPDGR